MVFVLEDTISDWNFFGQHLFKNTLYVLEDTISDWNHYNTTWTEIASKY